MTPDLPPPGLTPPPLSPCESGDVLLGEWLVLVLLVAGARVLLVKDKN